ncbi:hypothetical protein AB0O39_38575 [Streptomyces anulatus]|uniref:hypothetical protein n=1 Tax=Streptomyces anulatus TaxID=1892 RepID=UPI0034427862
MFLVAVLAFANQGDRSNDQADTATGRPQATAPFTSPEPWPTGSTALAPSRPSASQPTSSPAQAPPATEPTKRNTVKVSSLVATGTRLYRLTADSEVEEHNGSGGWSRIRKEPSDRLVTNASTLYATDSATGDILQYDAAKKTWTALGGPGGIFAATDDHLYGVASNHSAIFEYSGTPRVWHLVRGATDKIFTSGTTLYATEPSSGQLLQYDRQKKTWSAIGERHSAIAATKSNLYFLSPDRATVYRYTGRPGAWTPSARPDTASRPRTPRCTRDVHAHPPGPGRAAAAGRPTYLRAFGSQTLGVRPPARRDRSRRVRVA